MTTSTIGPVKYLIVIDGNIGVGKTSLLNELSYRSSELLGSLASKCSFLTEPVEKFSFFQYQNQCFDPLKELYQQTAETCMIQDYILKQSYEQFSNAKKINPEKPVLICERGILSSHPFISTYYQLGKMSDFSAAYLHDKTNCLWSSVLVEPILIIYLDLPIEEAKSRIQIRHRDSEKVGISDQFLTLLDNNFREFYQKLGSTHKICVNQIKLEPSWPVSKVAEKVAKSIAHHIVSYLAHLHRKI